MGHTPWAHVRPIISIVKEDPFVNGCVDCVSQDRARELLVKEKAPEAIIRPVSLAEKAFVLRSREVLLRRGHHQTMTDLVVLEQLASGERPVRCVVCG